MTKVKCSYLGNLNCEAIHIQSGSLIRTDAPLDHYGNGESFSPTDLLATSLGTCLLTIMAIKAKSKGFDLDGIYLNIEKLMTQNSERKIKELIIDIFIPDNTPIGNINFLKKASEDCPVTRNLSEEIDIKISWHHK
ncbi:OsmC family protein [Prochlorococcus marinus]|nr:OsmC family protein [Prochlorococcus marinus]